MVLFPSCNYFYYNYYIISIKKSQARQLEASILTKRGQCLPHQPLSYRSFFLLSKMNTLPMTYYLQPSLPIHHYHLHDNHLVSLC